MRLHLLITEAPERSLALQPCEEDTARRPHYEPGRGLSPAPESADALILDLPASRAVSNTFLLFISDSVCAIYFVIAIQTFEDWIGEVASVGMEWPVIKFSQLSREIQ